MAAARDSDDFVDDVGLPVPGLRILLEDRQPLGQFGSGTVTGPDGTFTATDVTPGSYFIRVLPSTPNYSKIEDDSDEAFKRTDQGYEDLVWPSGVSDPRCRAVGRQPGWDVRLGYYACPQGRALPSPIEHPGRLLR